MVLPSWTPKKAALPVFGEPDKDGFRFF